MKKTSPTLLLSISLLFLASSFFSLKAEEKTMKVFILAGQSNMAGRGSSKKIPKDIALPKGVLSFTAPNNTYLGDSLRKNKKEFPANLEKANWKKYAIKKGRIGPEVTFINTIKKQYPNEDIGFIKFAISSTSLHSHWLGEKSPYGKLSNHLMNLMETASSKKKIEFVGLIWVQGEGDSIKEDRSKAYAENLPKFIKIIREKAKNEKMPFVCARVNPPAPKYNFQKAVRDAIENNPLPLTGWVNCDDLSKCSDNVHYDTKGILELGERLANEFIKINK